MRILIVRLKCEKEEHAASYTAILAMCQLARLAAKISLRIMVPGASYLANSENLNYTS